MVKNFEAPITSFGLQKYVLNIKIFREINQPAIDACICSCHFRDGKKENIPELFSFNRDKLLTQNFVDDCPKRKNIKIVEQKVIFIEDQSLFLK